MKKAKIVDMWGSTIYHVDDLPFKPKEYLPHIYGKFREKSEGTRVREVLDTPKKGEIPFASKPGSIITKAIKFTPDLVKDLGYTKEEASTSLDKRTCYDFKGGEDAGLTRLREYLWDTKSVGSYASTRN